MTGAIRTGETERSTLEDLRVWLDETWDPTLTLRQWWARLASSGWSQPHWPREWYGRGMTPAEANDATRIIRDHGAVTAPTGFGTGMAGPTLLVHGTDDQRARHLPGIVDGTDAFCQLFSEPNAGSDLAGLQTRAERDGSDWVINGQKVWTSGGQIANKAILVARTNIDVPKHAGISFFIIDVRQPGVEIRPLREMTGRAFFNEVFMTDARVPGEDLVGGEGNGWAVANTLLAFERALSGGGETGATADPGPIASNLDRPAGSLVRGASSSGEQESNRGQFATLAEVAARTGRSKDPFVRDNLVRLYTLERLNTLNTLRARALEEAGSELAGLPNLAKMSQSHAYRLGRELTFSILQSAGTLHAYDEGAWAGLEDEAGVEGIGALVNAALFAQGPPIYGGSDQIQRNIVGDRVLGLPREPSSDRGVAFKDLLKN
jgi:alkylation response protein AidB-like acyl-CoA dehydrogenase